MAEEKERLTTELEMYWNPRCWASIHLLNEKDADESLTLKS